MKHQLFVHIGAEAAAATMTLGEAIGIVQQSGPPVALGEMGTSNYAGSI